MKYLLSFLMAIAGGSVLHAQNNTPDTLTLSRDSKDRMMLGVKGDTDTVTKKNRKSIYVGSGGIHYENGKKDSTDHAFEIQFGMLDLGVNSLVDKTEYPTGFYHPGTPSDFFQVPNSYVNKDLFSLRQSKSINVNIYPVMLKANLVRGDRQKLTLATGIGLQLYNFRFTKPVSYVSTPTTHVIMDTVSFSKNKLAFNYLTVPLMLNAKTRIAGPAAGKNSYWLVYGVGLSGGYLLSSWTKQISEERGKQKNHDPFNFNKTNLCVNGEIGLDGYFRLYASYQLTSLHETVLDQHPLSIGVRFLGL